MSFMCKRSIPVPTFRGNVVWLGRWSEVDHVAEHGWITLPALGWITLPALRWITLAALRWISLRRLVTHWKHLRTTNPIESTFATVGLRHRRTKGSGSRDACLARVYKLVEHAQQHWRKLDEHQLIPEVLAGRRFIDGIIDTTHRSAA